LIVLALALGALATATSRAAEQAGPLVAHEFTQVHMGMPVRLRFYAPASDMAIHAATMAFARIAELDSMMSDYRPASEVRRLAASSGTWVATSPDLFAVLSRAVDISRATNGAFDPTLGPLVKLWREARTSRQLPDGAAVASARTRVGWRWITFDRPRHAVRLGRPDMQLDLGGIAKGYIVQQALAAMAGAGVTRALVEAGGDIAVGDAPPNREGWSIDVDGADTAFLTRAARLTHASLATSGPTAQFVDIGGVQYSHVIDPRTGLGLTNHVTARVIGPDGATADALATALTIVDTKDVPRLQSLFPETLMSVER